MAQYIYRLARASFIEDETADDYQPFIADHQEECSCQDCLIFTFLLIFEKELNLFLQGSTKDIPDDRIQMYRYKMQEKGVSRKGMQTPDRYPSDTLETATAESG